MDCMWIAYYFYIWYNDAHRKNRRGSMKQADAMENKHIVAEYGWLIFFAMAFIFTLIALFTDSSTMDPSMMEASQLYDTQRNQCPIIRENTHAEKTILSHGSYVVGEDIPMGRYDIVSHDSGNIYIYENNRIIVNERFDPTGKYGITLLTLDLQDNQVIDVEGLEETIFTPAQTEVATTLHTGKWVVGLDIEPGEYIVTGEGLGNLFVYDGYTIKTNEILTNRERELSLQLGEAFIDLTLEEGQVIEINRLHYVHFEEKN